MSDDEADPELLELLRQSLGIGAPRKNEISSETGILKDAEYIYSNAIDVSIDMYGTKAAAASIYSNMQEREYSAQTWIEHKLHPKLGEDLEVVELVNFVFTMDLLNFSFWSERSQAERYQVEYRGRLWTGYSSLVACLRRALDEGVAITTPRSWSEGGLSDETLRNVFRSVTDEEIPLLDERISMLRETGRILHESFDVPEPRREEGSMDPGINEVADAQSDEETNAASPGISTHIPERNDDIAETAVIDVQTVEADTNTVEATPDIKEDGTSSNVAPKQMESEINRESQQPVPVDSSQALAGTTQSPQPDLKVVRIIEKADHSAGKLVNLLAKHFPFFNDEARFDGRRVRILKRAQILVADLWAAFNGEGYGKFEDIGVLTMFADYRVPQMLHSLGVLVYSPPLDYAIRDKKIIPSGHSWEVQLRGCSIWAVELIRREILRLHPDATNFNAVLIDFFLYDLAKEKEVAALPPRRQKSESSSSGEVNSLLPE